MLYPLYRKQGCIAHSRYQKCSEPSFWHPTSHRYPRNLSGNHSNFNLNFVLCFIFLGNSRAFAFFLSKYGVSVCCPIRRFGESHSKCQKVIRQGSGEHSCDDDDLNVIFHLRARAFDCVKKQSVSLVNNGCRTVNQKRHIF